MSRKKPLGINVETEVRSSYVLRKSPAMYMNVGELSRRYYRLGDMVFASVSVMYFITTISSQFHL